MIIYTSFILLGYLFGSIASAIIVCKLMGLGDPRKVGSGNPGTTNVLRHFGKKAATLTLGGDVLKGVLPVLLAKLFQSPDLIVALTGLSAFIGHLYPLFFHFRGGKGVATLVGVLCATHWLLGVAFIITWLVMAILFRYSSLSAIVATLLTPLYAWWFLPVIVYVPVLSLMSLALIWRHRTNIKNLMAGSEDKLSLK